MNKMDIENDPRVQEWYGLIAAKPNTQEAYNHFIKLFCECVKKTPSELIKESIEETKEGKLPAERTIISDMARYKKCMADKGYSDKTTSLGMTAIISFFKTFDIVLSSRIGKQKNPDVSRENKNSLAYEDVKFIVNNTNNAREHAAVLLMATSGLGMDEVINLKISDVVYDENGYGTISIRRGKSKVDFVTFCTPEAKEALDNYIKNRNLEPLTKVKGNDDWLFINYRDGGQMNERTFTKVFQFMAQRLGYKNKNGQRKGLFIRSRSHNFRKFFSKRLEQAGCPKHIIDIFLGHKQKGTDKAYFRHDIDDEDDIKNLKEKYKNYVKFLAFNAEYTNYAMDKEDVKKLVELEKTIEKKDKESTELRQQVLEANQKILDSKLEMETVKRQLSDMETIKKQYEELQKYVPMWQRFFDKKHGFAAGEPEMDMNNTAGQERLIKEIAKKSPEDAKRLIPKKKSDIKKSKKK